MTLADSLRQAMQQTPTLPLSEAYLEQERTLQAAGYHATSDWWLEQLRRLWEHPTAYRLVESVGRRGGKSSTIVRVAVCEVVDRDWHVPEGDPPHVFVFLSIKSGEACARLDGVEQILQVRDVGYHRGTDRMGPYIRLAGRPLEWRALPADFRTAVGFTCIGFVADELARWQDTSKSANPAAYVLASVRPAMVTHLDEGAHEYLISSPWTEEGSHYEAVSEGDTDDQIVAHAASWEANPTLTPEQCRRLCRSEQLEGQESDFDRDYAAIPMPLSAVGRLDPGLIVWLEAPPESQPGDVLLSGSDLAMKTNSSAQVRALLRNEVYLVRHVDEWRPTAEEPLRPTEVCQAQRDNLVDFGAVSTCADGHYRESLREAFLGTELVILDAPRVSTEPIVRLRTLMQEGKIRIWCGEEMKARLSDQLRGTRLYPTQNGLGVTMETARDGSHCDLVAALALCVWQQAGKVVPQPTKRHTALVGGADEKQRRAKLVKRRQRARGNAGRGRLRSGEL